jgi:elongator complex protein 4
MGHPDVDRLLGGGLPLGAVLLVVEGDASSRAHLPLLRCFLAEGVACGHDARWVVARAPAGGVAGFLPARAPPEGEADGRGRGKGAAGAAGATARESSTDGGGGGGKGDGDDGDGLQIAWQYRKYLRNPGSAAPVPTSTAANASSRSSASSSSAFVRRSGGGSSGGGGGSSSSAVEAGIGRAWCHAHDLSRPMGHEALAAAARLPSSSPSAEAAGPLLPSLETVECAAGGGKGPVAAACSAAVAFFEGPPGREAGEEAAGARAPQPALALALPRPPVTKVRRLLVQSLGSLDWLPPPPSSPSAPSAPPLLEAQVVRAVLRLRQAAQRPSPPTCGCCAVVSVDPHLLSPSALARLVHACDAAVRVAPLPDDAPAAALLPDAPSAVALLQLLKAPSAALQRQPAVDDRLFVLRSRRRTVRVTPVEVDPDAEAAAAAGGGGASGGGGGGGLGCAKNLTAKGLDF